jgi:hypothetical protein
MEHVAARNEESADRGPTDQDPAVAARQALLDARFGPAFADGGHAVARPVIAGAVARDEQLRRVPLANADEPVGSFVPHRSTDRGSAE